MLREGQKINIEDGDAVDFIAIANAIMDELVIQYAVKEVVFVKIKNWFDQKWLNYSGNTVVPFDFGGLRGHGHNTAKESVWRDKISIPPFHPHRVLASKFFVLEHTGNKKIQKRIHQYHTSNDNIHNRIENYTSDGLVLWFSSNSESLQKGSLMAYRVQNGIVHTWYATIENQNGWKPTKTKGISLDIIKSYLRFMNIEAKVIERFIVASKRERYLTLIAKAKTRHKFTRELAHFHDLEPGLFEEVKGDERKFIQDRIGKLGNLDECYLISESPELDQARMGIDEALGKVIGFGMGTLIVFGDAVVVYYEGELRDRWISR